MVCSVAFHFNLFLYGDSLFFTDFFFLGAFCSSTIRKNGFALEEDSHAPPGHRFKLKAVPFSKNITFGVAGNPYFGNTMSVNFGFQEREKYIGQRSSFGDL